MPPEGVATLRAFADFMPPPQRLELVRRDGREYIVWTGEWSGPFDGPSGPSCYLFDDEGRLVDWQTDTGDGGPVEDFLQASVEQGLLALEDALSVTQAAADRDDDAGPPDAGEHAGEAP